MLIGQMVGGVFVAIISFILAERVMKNAENTQFQNQLNRIFSTSSGRSTFCIIAGEEVGFCLAYHPHEEQAPWQRGRFQKRGWFVRQLNFVQFRQFTSAIQS